MAKTMTISEACDAGLLDPENIDPHEFAPYCEHDLYRTLPVMREPLYSCEICDEDDEA